MVQQRLRRTNGGSDRRVKVHQSIMAQSSTMRKFLPKTLDLLIFSIYSLNFSLDHHDDQKMF